MRKLTTWTKSVQTAQRQQLCVTAESDRFGFSGTHMHTTARHTEICNTERNDWTSQPDRQTDTYTEDRRAAADGRHTFDRWGYGNTLRDLLPREERFDKTSLRKSSTGSARVVHPKQLLSLTKQKVYVRWISATSSRYQLSRIPQVHYSSHKSPATELYLEPQKSRSQPNTLFFLLDLDPICPPFPVTVPVSRKIRFGIPNVPGFFKP